MTTNAPVMYEVLDGPGIQETIDSFTWAFTGTPHFVEFLVRRPGSNPEIVIENVKITAIKYESGAPGIFLLEFSARGFTKCHGYYNGHSRKGHFSMTTPWSVRHGA